jgi:hypothetical protein
MVGIRDDAIKKLARLARLPATLDLDHFGKDAFARRYGVIAMPYSSGDRMR